MKVFIKAKETENGLSIRYREGDTYFVEDVKFNNYFYLKESDVFDDSKLFNFCKSNFLKGQKVVSNNGTFLKCYLKFNTQRNYLRKIIESDFEVEVFEGDINAVKHWLIENQDVELNSKEMRVKYYDIETDDRGEFKKEIDGTVIAYKPVMSCAFLDHNKKTSFYINENVDDSSGLSEVELLKKIAEEINNSDLITAWNGMRFDEPYLRQREEHYNLVSFNWHGVNRFDELVKFKRSRTGFKKYSLSNVSQVLLKDDKIDFSEESAGEGKFYNLWKNNKKLLEEYNIKDVVLMDKIEEITKDYNIHKMCAELCHCPFEDTLFNSMMSDYLILNRYKNKNLIAPSKPNEAELEHRQRNALISGGYTFCFKPGHWKNINVVDYKSHYPLAMMTFNISPETLVKEIDVDWEEVKTFLTEDEYITMKTAESLTSLCINKKGKFLTGQYKKELKKAGIDYNLKDLMFKFIDNYKGLSIEKYCKENDYIFTPADFNLDSNGWHFHKHRIFTRARGVIPDLQEFVLKERDRIKLEINSKVEEFGLDYKNTDEYLEKFFYQIGIKLVGNATFGFLGFLKSRFYQWEVADSITTCGRYIIKKSILFAEKQGWTVTSGDTDSLFITKILEDGTQCEISPEEIDYLYFEYYKELFKPFNTNFEISVKNPKTKEKELLKYWCQFEFEHRYNSIIIAAKKRYYFLEEYRKKDGTSDSVVNSKGGAFIKTDTNPLAAELQKKLCEDILKDRFDKNHWLQIIAEWKDKCYNNKLEEKYLTYIKTYSKHWSLFGQIMLDKETGEPKVNKEGEIRRAAIPSHIKMIQRLDELKKIDIQVGDVVEFIIAKPKLIDIKSASRKKIDKEIFDGYYEEFKDDLENLKIQLDCSGIQYKEVFESNQQAISLDEYREGVEYDAEAYWNRIISPIVEIVSIAVEDKEEFYKLANMTEKQIKKLLEELDEEETET